tara:strand:+ start:572 stop:1006 length:435 start_codon:yes stop_codon:yes gene_type:complete
MVVSIGCDHAAFNEKNKVKEILIKLGYEVLDFGTSSSESVDYPSFGHKVGLSIINKSADKGIVICGSGIGISIAANKIKGIRAALCTSIVHAELSRKHNDANVLALGARLTKMVDIESIVKVWLETSFEGGRHQKRIEKIEYYE